MVQEHQQELESRWSELFPTFGWAKSKVDFVIAGGTKALTSSVENSEDDKIAAKNMIKN